MCVTPRRACNAWQAAAFGKRAEALATDIIPHLKASLMYEVAEGIK
jgi:hypothetical protein